MEDMNTTNFCCLGNLVARCSTWRLLSRLEGFEVFSVFDLGGDHGACVAHGCDGFIVAAAEGVGTYFGHLFEHFGAVFKVADAAAFVVAPGDGDLDDRVLQLACNEEDFWVEPPALDGLKAEDGLGGFAAEGLKTALGVLVGQADQAAGDAVEAAAKKTAVDGLVDGLFLLIEPARADGNVSTGVNRFEEAFGFFDGGGEIGVGEHDDIAASLQEAVANGVAFAAVSGIADELDLRSAGHPSLNGGDGGVCGSIVDDENFGVPVAIPDAFEDARERCVDASTFVICRNDDAEARLGHELLRPFVMPVYKQRWLSITLLASFTTLGVFSAVV